uniref:FAD-dependent oxidoreductase domain-containing protein 1 n=1 Tax=Wuchereria bancrofti TaxID=6293 RepID=A0AAF5Q1N4_WUCBA
MSHLNVVVGGGGIAGTSIAYHLAKRGKVVALLERNRTLSVGQYDATNVSVGLVIVPLLHWQDPAK